jgi:predicted DNA-binding transcriptional regulator YafY
VAQTAGRLLDLLALLQVRRAWTGGELAERLGVTDRTVRNDVARLRALGYRVEGVRGTAGGYRLAAGTRMPPLLLDDADVVAIAVGLLTTTAGGVAGLDDNAPRALGKLQQVRPPALQRRVDALRDAVLRVPPDDQLPAVDPDLLAVIAAACRDHLVLRFDYRSHDAEHASRRRVEPYRLISWGRRWYLLAFDPARDGWRTYRVDRLVLSPPPGPRFRPREAPAEDVAAYVSRGAASAAWQHHATVTVQAPASALAAKVPAAAGIVEAVDDRTCRFTTGADTVATLAAHLGRLDADFRVDGPPALVAQLRTLADRYRRAIEPDERPARLVPNVVTR